jgi:hypothetical protein
MKSLKEQLAALDPPLKHVMLDRGNITVISLIDPSLPAKVERSLDKDVLSNNLLLYAIIREAVNELRHMGGHPAITETEISAAP